MHLQPATSLARSWSSRCGRVRGLAPPWPCTCSGRTRRPSTPSRRRQTWRPRVGSGVEDGAVSWSGVRAAPRAAAGLHAACRPSRAAPPHSGSSPASLRRRAAGAQLGVPGHAAPQAGRQRGCSAPAAQGGTSGAKGGLTAPLPAYSVSSRWKLVCPASWVRCDVQLTCSLVPHFLALFAALRRWRRCT